ncbi:leucine-rich_repeat-containing protein [Hexamita inflata]|uniref:Leucine-rich repeat-containing protein n=1 Tax=Hexamita inflata TaxID=28002 RepID=A0AA86UJW5_9EUKA|nr:leucine-rich repeat-containing protein [Hexamita inflata]
MKPTEDKIKKLRLISDKTKFTDTAEREASCFEAKNTMIKQVDQIPMHATSLVVINSHLCSTLGINLHVNVTYLDLRSNYLQTVDLKFLVNLEYLDLSANFLKEVDSISGNKKIKTLNLASNKIQKINFISTLPQLKEFNIEENMVYDIQPIYKHSNFSLSWASIQKSIQVDSKLEKENTAILFWRCLNTMVVRFRDKIEFKEGHYVLRISNDQELVETVFLDYLKVTEVFITECHNVSFAETPKLLKQLCVFNSDIKSLSGLEKMVQLECLTLRQCSLSRIQGQLETTKKLPNLRYLDVAQNSLDNIHFVCNEKLTSLNVSQNNLKSLDGLGNVQNLASLDVSGNHLESVSELADLTDLTELNISFNAIKSVQCLNRQTKLVYFNLMSNKVMDIEVCMKMENLIDLRTHRNFIQNGYVLAEHPNVTQAWLSEQLEVDENDKEGQKLKEQSKNSNMIEKYGNQVKNNSLEVKSDSFIKNLRFSDLINVTKELSISQCKNVTFQVVPVLVQNLKVNSSGLQNIYGLEQMTQVTSLELSDNLLEDVIEIQELTKLTRLVLSNNRISRLHWIKALTQLRYLDIQNNKFVSVECLKDVQSLAELYIQENMVQNIDYLRLLKQFNEKWISPQKDFGAKDVEYYLGPNSNQQMVKECTSKLLNAKKYLIIALKYKNHVNGSKLAIQNSSDAIDLSFVSVLSDLINQQINSVSVDNCPNIQGNVQHPILQLTITNSQLKNLGNLTATTLIYLDLGFNNLEDVSAIETLTSLQKLILRDNRIRKLDFLKSLVKLVHLDVRNNKLLYVSFIKFLPLLSELFVDGNFICNLYCVAEHPKCNKCISIQRDPTQDEVWNYLGQCTKQQFDAEFRVVQEQVKQRNSMPQYQYLITMIQKYENKIQLKTQITVFNVSENESDQIWEINRQTQNCQRETFGRNERIECDSKDSQTVLNKIMNVNATFKVEVEEFRQLQINWDNELKDLSFVNVFNIQNLVFRKMQFQMLSLDVKLNVKFHGVANIKVLHANNCGLQSIDGIQNWNQLLELNLDGNKLASVAQLENLTQLKVLNLGLRPFYSSQNRIQNVEALRGLVNLTTLWLDSNQIENVEPLRGLVNLTYLYLQSNKIENVEPLRGLVNLTYLYLQNNQIQNVEPLRGLVNLTYLYLQNNQIQNVEPLRELVNLTNLDLSSNPSLNLDSVRGLVNLTTLWLNSNQIENVEALRGLVNLTTLRLDSNQIQNVESLRGLVNLTTLWLDSNQIENVEPLRGLVNLTRLELQNNQIQNVEPLRGLVNLTYLSLRENQIQNVEPLRGLVNLTTLWLDSNQIENVEPLRGLVNLTYLYLQSNKIENVEPLRGLVNLTYLYLQSNKIENVEPLRGLVNLRDLDLQNNKIKDFSPIQNHPNFKNSWTWGQK